MQQQAVSQEFELLKRSTTIQAFRTGYLGSYLDRLPSLQVSGAGNEAEIHRPSSQELVFSGYVLQDIPDYREAIRSWFALLKFGGNLVIVVPHAFLYERKLALPSEWNYRQRRLYTPATLLNEVEEALAPNAYRVRFLSDDDSEYDYGVPLSEHPLGRHDVVLVLEKRVPPSWDVAVPLESVTGPDFEFEPRRTRVETVVIGDPTKVLALKLDHLGDFIMGVPALENLRATFPNAHIALVVGSWNRSIAEGLGLFDEVIAFDAFPRNSSEERPNVLAKVPAFDGLITDSYDLAIDLRTDSDTRVLLRNVRARSKAGIGFKAQFDFLDIFLPIDSTRGGVETAREIKIPLTDFSSNESCHRSRFQIACKVRAAGEGGAIIWGPYYRIEPGEYRFEPYLEVDPTTPGTLELDIAVDRRRLISMTASDMVSPVLSFNCGATEAEFEFRIWPAAGQPIPAFQFFGGRLLKRGGSGVLHSSEYLLLLVDLVRLRTARIGMLHE